MSVEIRQLKDKHTGASFVPVTHWDAIANKPTMSAAAYSGDISDLGLQEYIILNGGTSSTNI